MESKTEEKKRESQFSLIVFWLLNIQNNNNKINKHFERNKSRQRAKSKKATSNRYVDNNDSEKRNNKPRLNEQFRVKLRFNAFFCWLSFYLHHFISCFMVFILCCAMLCYVCIMYTAFAFIFIFRSFIAILAAFREHHSVIQFLLFLVWRTQNISSNVMFII